MSGFFFTSTALCSKNGKKIQEKNLEKKNLDFLRRTKLTIRVYFFMNPNENLVKIMLSTLEIYLSK